MSTGLIVFLYAICAYGISNMMVFSSGPFRLFEFIRDITDGISEHFGSMFKCMICFPANVGWICSLVDWFFLKNVAITPFNILLCGTNLWWLALICDCCFTSGIVWITHNVESFFESIAEGKNEQNIDEEDVDAIDVHNN